MKLRPRENCLERILLDLIMKMPPREDGRKIKEISHTKKLTESITCLNMTNLMLFNTSLVLGDVRNLLKVL